MKRALICFAAALILWWNLPAVAQEKPADKDKPPAEAGKKPEAPKAEQSVTQHSVVIGGTPVAYTATAGTLIVRNEKDEPWASMGYTAYVKKDGGLPDGGRSRSPTTAGRAPRRCGCTWAPSVPSAS